MLKKLILFTIIISFFMSFSLEHTFAYEYAEKDNEAPVESMVTELFDRKSQYEDLAGRFDEESVSITDIDDKTYWWPIGSEETEKSKDGKTELAGGDPETVDISSQFGYRTDPFGSGETKFHSGLDISGGRGLGKVNIIAAKDGTVVYSTKGSVVCPSGSKEDPCGGGYGNHVIIQHTDGNYTLYAHLYENSLTVSEGDSVKQGQVIGKMGSSGYSTAAHLHFEVREGQNDISAAVDPLEYIDPDNPRPAGVASELVEFVRNFEGTEGSTGDSYIIGDCGDGYRTVGYGVVLESNASKFAAHGIDINNYTFGDTIPKSIVDAVEKEELGDCMSYIEKSIAKEGITLNANQKNALTSMCYNCGPGSIDDFVSVYKKNNGNDDAIHNSFFLQWTHATMNGIYGVVNGLVRRREAEWNMYKYGKYEV